MDVFSPFEQVPASKVEPGSIVILNWGRMEKTVALVVKGERLRSPAFLLLQPGHPVLDRPAIYTPDDIGDAPVFVVRSARAVIEGQASEIAYSRGGGDVPAGALFQLDDGRFAVMAHVATRELAAFILENGEMQPPDWRRAWFPTWSITAEAPHDKVQRLCTIAAALPEDD